MALGRHQLTVTDEAGNVIPGAHVEVRVELPGQALAALFDDRDGLSPITNPFDADGDGFAFFHVEGGAYRVRVYTGSSGAPTFEKIWRYVPVGMARERDSFGDLYAANNLSDLASKKTAKDNLSIHGADVASSSTLNLEAATGDLVDVTGTTAITAITLSEGHERIVRFTGALTLTHGASLVLPGGSNITTAAGDFAVFRGYASSVVRCVAYSEAAAIAAGGMRNRLINPSGQIWQRANSGAAAITDVAYAFDRWYGLTQSNGVTASQQTGVENGTPFMMRLSQANASAQRFGLAQVIENSNCIDLRGQVVTLSARARMSASTTLRFAILEWTGSADTVTKDFVNSWTNGTFTTGNFFTSTSTTLVATGSVALTANTLANISLAGAVSNSMNNLAVMFWTDSTQAQNVTLDIGRVQLERGGRVTAPAVRSLQEELALCQRYYEKSYGISVAPAAVTSAGARAFVQNQSGSPVGVGNVQYQTRKRTTAPNVTIYSPNDGATGNGYDGSNRALTTGNAGDMGFIVTGLGNATTAISFHFVAENEL